MLETLQGDTHEVFTGVAVAAWEDSLEVVSTVDVTEVTMMTMTAEEIDDYVSGGEPMGKAGAYAIQGEGGRFVTSVRGSPFTVVGLPIHLIARLFAAVGSDINRFRRRN
jgi:septum formation protein